MLRTITSARHAALTFSLLILINYAILPALVGWSTGLDLFGDMVHIAAISAGCVYFGSFLPVFDWLHSSRIVRIALPVDWFLALVWIPFFVFVLTTWATAPGIPIVAAFSGADAHTIAVLREEFLKARTGWQHSFVYINALFAGALVPYAQGTMFLHKSRYRWWCFAGFLLYSLSFSEKGFFFKAAAPLVYLIVQRQITIPIVSPRVAIASVLALLVAVTILAKSGTVEADDTGDFFSDAFVPQGALQHIVWRSVAIPVLTASDGIRLFRDDFQSRPLGGATSSALAYLTGKPRVEFERLTFAAEWGQNETGTGSANAAFFVEALVNFGMPGVIGISLIIGLILRGFATTRDQAMKGLWLLFAMGVYTSGLISLVLSNGFLPLFLFVGAVNMKSARSAPRSVMASIRIPQPTV